jgi:hypothetical protein
MTAKTSGATITSSASNTSTNTKESNNTISIIAQNYFTSCLTPQPRYPLHQLMLYAARCASSRLTTTVNSWVTGQLLYNGEQRNKPARCSSHE